MSLVGSTSPSSSNVRSTLLELGESLSSFALLFKPSDTSMLLGFGGQSIISPSSSDLAETVSVLLSISVL